MKKHIYGLGIYLICLTLATSVNATTITNSYEGKISNVARSDILYCETNLLDTLLGHKVYLTYTLDNHDTVDLSDDNLFVEFEIDGWFVYNTGRLFDTKYHTPIDDGYSRSFPNISFFDYGLGIPPSSICPIFSAPLLSFNWSGYDESHIWANFSAAGGRGSLAMLGYLSDYRDPVDYIDGYYSWATVNYILRSEVPEPTSLVLFGAGLAGLARVSRKRKDKP